MSRQDLEILAKLGDDGPDGPATVFNLQTLIELKRQKLVSDQLLDPGFAIPIRRLNLVFGAPSLFVIVFANGTTQQATKHIMTSFLMSQTFPDNWFRGGAPTLGASFPAQIAAALPEWIPGHNDENGVFVADPPAPAPFNISGACANYWDLLTNAVPGSLANVTGIFKQNVDMLTGVGVFRADCAGWSHKYLVGTNNSTTFFDKRLLLYHAKLQECALE
ncbi:hypothetical protein B0H14DRAFT_3470099 [Mycena olivaceomarginata]|nr:hypothetical protein B0H14DRAFT_3470099 [Mycena olivaceomarginata]